MIRKLTLTNSKTFFENSHIGEIFETSSSFNTEDTILTGLSRGYIVAYCGPNTPEYKTFGGYAYRISKKISKYQIQALIKDLVLFIGEG
jgi:hypothetical protein